MADLLSVGIDIGTSTTQVVFSRLELQNTSGFFSVPNVAITEKKLLYKSTPHSTPLSAAYRLDADKLEEIVRQEYEKAGYLPENVETGAVIITGESARKENAALVLSTLSRLAGDFVVSTAGPDLESVIAGKGSGACAWSEKNAGCAFNLDIGGGTTNIAVFREGEAISCGCYDIGGRLLCFDEGRIIRKISPSAQKLIDHLQLPLRVGSRADTTAVRALTDKMAELLAEALGILPAEPLLEELTTSGSSRLRIPVGCAEDIFFSGGVADFLYSAKEFGDYPFQDIGALLGKSIRSGTLFRHGRIHRAQETIAATVIGAGTYTTTLSGSTITSDASVLPRKNLPVLKLFGEAEKAILQGDGTALREQAAWFMSQHDTESLALAMEGPENPDYISLQRLAEAVISALEPVLPPTEPIYLVMHQDTAKALGLIMRRRLENRRKCVVLDGIRLSGEAFIDIGAPLMDGLVVPVVLKTLIFG